MYQSPGGDRSLLSTRQAGRVERNLALTVVAVSSAIFVVVAPFAKVPLGQVAAFIPIYQSALVVNDIITAVLLFGQFSCVRSRGLLLLAIGYLFTAFMAVAHLMTFPGLFSETGLLGAGPQSTAWLYMFWHGGFPCAVAAYALSTNPDRTIRPRRGTRDLILSSVILVMGAVGALTLLVTLGHDVLPAIMSGHRYTPVMLGVVSSVWLSSLGALLLLWRRGGHTVLGLWLMVVLCAWLFDIALAAVLNGGRFDLGFYAGRLYGLLAASFVLGVLLVEHGRLYYELDRHNQSLEQTVRQRTEQLLQSEKVATMGSLVAGVAHELNNPLAVLLGQTELLQRAAAGSAVAERAEKIGTAAERCRRVVKNFLALARQQPPERGYVRVRQVIDEAIELLAYELRTDNVTVTVHAADGLPTLWADAHQLHQVIVNLVANAHQAMRQTPGPRAIAISAQTDAARGEIRLEVADTGPGIPPEFRSKIFEPFFTTKPAGQGTGLGLSLCRGIVEDHGGSIVVDSELGHGTTFTLTLPVTARPAMARGPAADAAPAPVGPKRILVVDDERDLAEVLVDVLQRDGHHVDAAFDGADALRRLEREPFDLVVSDTKMPLMDGLELFREIDRRFSALRRRVIFVTGDVLDVEKRQALESIGVPVLVKPFDLTEVRNLVRRQLTTSA
jgi:two-component system sensor histidine kinase/response regulator